MGFVKNFLNYNKDDSLIRDSFILFIASMFANVAGFFYHFYMGRVLGPVDYGILGVVFSIAYLINVPATVVQTGVTKFTADFLAKGENETAVYKIHKTIFSKMFVYAFLLMMVFLLFSGIISNVLKISIYPLFVFAPYILFALMLPVLRGFLQGRQLFKKLGINLVLESVFKLVFGIGLVYFGFRVYGAVVAVVIASFLACLLIYFNVKKFNLSHNVDSGNVENNIEGDIKNKFEISDFYKYIKPVFFALLFLTLLYTIDVFFVKHYFSEHEAGLYTALSLIGRIVFFASSAVSMVMFPKVVDLAAKGKMSRHILYKSLFFVALIGIPIIIFYLVFPEIVVLMLVGNDYLWIADKLWLFGVIMLLFSLNYVFVFYNLSIGKKKFLPILFFVFIFEVLFLFFFHKSMLEILIGLVLLNLILLISMVGYTLRGEIWKG